MRKLLFLLILCMSSPSFSQTQQNPNDFLQLAMQTTTMVDNGQSGALWDSSSVIMKNSAPKEQFSSITEQRRKIYGVLKDRDWEAIIQQEVGSGNAGVPPGRYLTVIMVSTSGNGQAVKEQISFLLDKDSTWRIVGYTIGNR